MMPEVTSRGQSPSAHKRGSPAQFHRLLLPDGLRRPTSSCLSERSIVSPSAGFAQNGLQRKAFCLSIWVNLSIFALASNLIALGGKSSSLLI